MACDIKKEALFSLANMPLLHSFNRMCIKVYRLFKGYINKSRGRQLTRSSTFWIKINLFVGTTH